MPSSLHRLDQHLPAHGPAQWGGVEVGPPGAADVPGPALQGDQVLVGELLATVDDAGLLRPIAQPAARDVVKVDLVILPEVGRVSVWDTALGLHPANGGRGIEPARERDANALANGERRENL